MTPYKGKIVKQTVNSPDGRKMSIYGFPDKQSATQKEVEWEQQTISKFFKFGKDLPKGKKSQAIYEAIVGQIEGKSQGLKLDNLCRRSFIIALCKVLTKYNGMPNLLFGLGQTIIKFEKSEEIKKVRQLGNFKMVIPSLGKYQIAYGEGCIDKLKYLVQPKWDYGTYNAQQRKKRLSKLISEGLSVFKPFEPKHLNKYGNIHIDNFDEGEHYESDKPQTIRDNVDYLNGLIFLVSIVEVLVRAYRTKEGELFAYPDPNGATSDLFPVAMAQTRSLFLLLEDKTFDDILKQYKDFFGQAKSNDEDYGAAYGAVTGVGTTSNSGLVTLSEKLAKINEKFNKFQSKLNNWPFKELKIEYLESNKNGYFISGKSKMARELRIIYGSGPESDENTSDYSDDSEIEAIQFKPSTKKS